MYIKNFIDAAVYDLAFDHMQLCLTSFSSPATKSKNLGTQLLLHKHPLRVSSPPSHHVWASSTTFPLPFYSKIEPISIAPSYTTTCSPLDETIIRVRGDTVTEHQFRSDEGALPRTVLISWRTLIWKARLRSRLLISLARSSECSLQKLDLTVTWRPDV